MNAATEAPQGETPSDPGQTTGQLLRAAREARGLSREDVAAQLRLKVNWVDALETDDLSAMPAPTFAAGYLRSYARLLGMEDAILPPKAEPAAQQPELRPNVRVRRQASSSDLPVRLVTYLVVLGLAALLIAQWVDWREGAERAPDTAVEAGPEMPAAEEPAPGVTVSDVGPAAPDEPPAVEAPADEAPVPETQTVEQPGVETVPIETPGAAAGTEQAAAAPAVAAGQAPAAPATARLVVRYQADSWTEIRDANGEPVLVALGRAGETVRVAGQAPFRVLFGYAPGVRLEYNGRPYDLARHTRNDDVARFRLGRAGDGAP